MIFMCLALLECLGDKWYDISKHCKTQIPFDAYFCLNTNKYNWFLFKSDSSKGAHQKTIVIYGCFMCFSH